MKINFLRGLIKRTLMLTLIVFAMQSFATEQPSGMHPKAQLDFVRKQIKAKKEPYLSAFKQLIQKADSALLVNNHAVEDFRVPGYYQQKAEHQSKSLALQVDAFSAYSCALAWQFTNKKVYAEKALYFLSSWATTNKAYSELDGSLVMSYSGSAMLMAAELLKPYSGWKADDKALFTNWVKNVFIKAAHSIRYRNNNSGDWSRLATVLGDCFIGDVADIKKTTEMIKADLFNKIAPDGHMVEEVKRQGNGIWYTYFSLAPLTASMWVIYNTTGDNLFTLEKDGSSVKKALERLLYYNQHPEEWIWFKNPVTSNTYTSVGFWPVNLLEAMHYIYPNDNFEAYIAPHRPIMYSKHDYAWTFPTLMPVKLNGYN
ncbi:alginate lyase family protein [Mucilaginibacter aquatilis]|uniref:Alginate lyase domain-containing protein n=1 Tax=Mucilaginibacter aquatilis TaxID=1517760 RepID=A0A6I4I925_9SPHI|nr:alginate lyase family protein [Mucilaginibacter aquatilis]MVN91755.1 hypothetical protein [Mucilaginibacter aquatilis]